MKSNNCSYENIKSIKGNYWNYKKPSKKIVDRLEKKYGLSKIVASILANRELSEKDLNFISNPSLKSHLPDPYNLKNMKQATEIVAKKIIDKEKIGLLGDYDVDGASSTAILYKYLKDIDIKSEVYIPDRIKDGYGISLNSIEYFKEKKVSFLITLDCGTNDTKSIDHAKSLGIDIIVIDHHEVKNLGMPLEIINPKLKDDLSGLENLCTVGLVFLFIVALNRSLRTKKFFSDNFEPNLKKLLDIVALGTICDLVPLRNVNRLLVKKGLDMLNLQSNLGLAILKNKLNIIHPLKASDLAYYIGPCINAAGRIGDSKLGFSLLVKEEKEELEKIADKLIINNKERKTLEIMAYKEAKKMANNFKNKNYIFVSSKNWHPGVIGIIAAKLVEDFKKPSFVLSIRDDIAMGSVRSIYGIDISKILSLLLSLGYIESGGGHMMAGGLKLRKDKINKLTSYLENNQLIFSAEKKYNIDIDLISNIESLNLETIEKLEKLEPYGMGNAEPKIVLRDVNSVYSKKIGREKNHISCTLEDIYGNKINAIAFNSVLSNLGDIIEKKSKFDVIGKVSKNNFYRESMPQFIIEDIKIN